MTVEFLDDEAIADIAFIVKNDSIKSVFLEAGETIFSLQTDTTLLDEDLSFSFKLSGANYERLLYNILAEILYYKDAELFFPKSMEIEFKEANDEIIAIGQFHGTIFNDEIHTRGNDIKAITMHDFYLKQVSEGWEAYILIDI